MIKGNAHGMSEVLVMKSEWGEKSKFWLCKSQLWDKGQNVYFLSLKKHIWLIILSYKVKSYSVNKVN